MEMVNLYTMQHQDSLNELKKHGRIINKERYIIMHMGSTAQFVIPHYRTFSNLAKQLVPRPEDVIFPIWCGVTQESSFVVEKGYVVYCLTVPVDQVIYFDGGKWDLVLNNLYVPEDQADAEAYAKELKELGFPHQFGILENYGGMYPELFNKIRDSWKRLFVIDEWDEHRIQANLWQIKEEWVQHVVHDGDNLYEVAADMEKTFPPQFAMNQLDEEDIQA